LEKSYREIKLKFEIPVEGFVNSLQFSSDGNFLIAGIGQEHRLGRWWRIKEAKNVIMVFPLTKKE
jgi:ribosomal RNA-processing protein 9